MAFKCTITIILLCVSCIYSIGKQSWKVTVTTSHEDNYEDGDNVRVWFRKFDSSIAEQNSSSFNFTTETKGLIVSKTEENEKEKKRFWKYVDNHNLQDYRTDPIKKMFERTVLLGAVYMKIEELFLLSGYSVDSFSQIVREHKNKKYTDRIYFFSRKNFLSIQATMLFDSIKETFTINFFSKKFRDGSITFKTHNDKIFFKDNKESYGILIMQLKDIFPVHLNKLLLENEMHSTKYSSFDVSKFSFLLSRLAIKNGYSISEAPLNTNSEILIFNFNKVQ